MSHFARLAVKVFGLLVMIAAGSVAHAQGVEGLLPVTQAFELSVDARTPGVVRFHWSIAPDYYLYREQMEFAGGEGVTLGTPQMPKGTKFHDEFLGDVEIYRGVADASIPYTLTPGTRQIRFSVTYQGCHDVAPKICYPPHEERFDLPRPHVGVEGTGGGASGPSHGIGAGSSASGASASLLTLSRLDAGRVPLGFNVGFLSALLLAFASGLILNLMPCVLPVLSITAIGLLENRESRSRIRRQVLGYAAGVLCSLVVIGLLSSALRLLGYTIGWGAQLQRPLLVGVLVCVMVAVGLSMSGMTHFGTSLGNMGHGIASRSGWIGNFITGVLAVVLASPCVAPFMDSALAYAFVAPMIMALLVFVALGMGLALPLLLIGFIPALGRVLPRPGGWMETMKEALAFPMYLSAVWLVWVLAHQRGADAVGLVLTAAVVLAMALWWSERSRDRGTPARALTAILALLAVAPLYGLSKLQPVHLANVTEQGVVDFSPERLAELRKAGMPVFVDMTADWCITCKANEYAVLDTGAFRDLLERTGTVYMVGDWTDVNPTIGAFLHKYQSPGVPLYVFFPKDGGAETVLPTVLTLALVRKALTFESK